MLLYVCLAISLVAAGAPRTLVGEADLDGDGRLEVVWKSMTHGAHTEFAWVYANSGAPPHSPLPGTPVTMASPESATLEGDAIVLKGGLIGSVGAGQAQRSRTDTYRWDGEKIALVDRRFAPSEYSYHRLQDGIVAEQFGHTAVAEQAYLSATDPRRPVLAWEMADPEREVNLQLGAAVRTFARFRLGLLLRREGSDRVGRLLKFHTGGRVFSGLLEAAAQAPDPEAACRAAAAWAEQNPAFLEALNSPYGYANPRWAPETLCGPLPEAG